MYNVRHMHFGVSSFFVFYSNGLKLKVKFLPPHCTLPLTRLCVGFWQGTLCFPHFIFQSNIQASIWMNSSEVFLQVLSSNLSAFQTFLAAAFYQLLAVSQSLCAQINSHTNTHLHTNTERARFEYLFYLSIQVCFPYTVVWHKCEGFLVKMCFFRLHFPLMNVYKQVLPKTAPPS